MSFYLKTFQINYNVHRELQNYLKCLIIFLHSLMH